MRLSYRTHLSGELHAPLLVFIPGWTMPAAIWQQQLSHFAGKLPLAAFDPRGQGDSAVPSVGYSLERRAQDLREFLDCFPGRNCVLVAWSLAVFEVLAYIDLCGQDRLQGLVLVDNTLGETVAPPTAAGENPFFHALRADRDAAVEEFIDLMFHVSPPAEIRAMIRASMLKMNVEDSISLLSHGRPSAYWRTIVERITRPILYLVTSRWAAQAELLMKKHARIRAHVFENAGHALFWDEAQQFNHLLADFVRTDSQR